MQKSITLQTAHKRSMPTTTVCTLIKPERNIVLSISSSTWLDVKVFRITLFTHQVFETHPSKKYPLLCFIFCAKSTSYSASYTVPKVQVTPLHILCKKYRLLCFIYCAKSQHGFHYGPFTSQFGGNRDLISIWQRHFAAPPICRH